MLQIVIMAGFLMPFAATTQLGSVSTTTANGTAELPLSANGYFAGYQAERIGRANEIEGVLSRRAAELEIVRQKRIERREAFFERQSQYDPSDDDR